MPCSVPVGASCCSCLPTHTSLNFGGNGAEEWWKVSARTMRTVCPADAFNVRHVSRQGLTRDHTQKGATLGQTACCCCCGCFGRRLTEQTVYVNMSLRANWQEPSSTHRRVLEGSNTGAQLRDNRRSAKNGVNTAEKAYRRQSPPETPSRELFSVAQLECPLSPARTESEALPLYNRRCMVTGRP